MYVCYTEHMYIGSAWGNVRTNTNCQPNYIGKPTALGDAPNDTCLIRNAVTSNWTARCKGSPIVYRWEHWRRSFVFLRHWELKQRAMTKTETTGIYRQIKLRNLKTTVWYARTNVIGSRTSLLQSLFVPAYIEICVFRGNPFQAHSLQQSYHPTQQSVPGPQPTAKLPSNTTI
jgi:hypothetical protein